MSMKNEFRYDSINLQPQFVELTQMAVNMTYDAVPRESEADQPLIVIETDEPQKLGE
jgi:hypothetical protein